MDNNEKLKAIKRSFRLFMNGVTSQSMREKGLDYKINWGISQPDLRRIASSYDKDMELADMLGGEDKGMSHACHTSLSCGRDDRGEGCRMVRIRRLH